MRRLWTGFVRRLSRTIGSLTLAPPPQARISVTGPFRSEREALAADAEALAGDWARVGTDLARSITRFGHEAEHRAREACGAPPKP